MSVKKRSFLQAVPCGDCSLHGDDVFGFDSRASRLDASAPHRVPDDWTHHHLVFSTPHGRRSRWGTAGSSNGFDRQRPPLHDAGEQAAPYAPAAAREAPLHND